MSSKHRSFRGLGQRCVGAFSWSAADPSSIAFGPIVMLAVSGVGCMVAGFMIRASGAWLVLVALGVCFELLGAALWAHHSLGGQGDAPPSKGRLEARDGSRTVWIQRRGVRRSNRGKSAAGPNWPRADLEAPPPPPSPFHTLGEPRQTEVKAPAPPPRWRSLSLEAPPACGSGGRLGGNAALAIPDALVLGVSSPRGGSSRGSSVQSSSTLSGEALSGCGWCYPGRRDGRAAAGGQCEGGAGARSCECGASGWLAGYVAQAPEVGGWEMQRGRRTGRTAAASAAAPVDGSAGTVGSWDAAACQGRRRAGRRTVLVVQPHVLLGSSELMRPGAYLPPPPQPPLQYAVPAAEGMPGEAASRDE